METYRRTDRLAGCRQGAEGPGNRVTLRHARHASTHRQHATSPLPQPRQSCQWLVVHYKLPSSSARGWATGSRQGSPGCATTPCCPSQQASQGEPSCLDGAGPSCCCCCCCAQGHQHRRHRPPCPPACTRPRRLRPPARSRITVACQSAAETSASTLALAVGQGDRGHDRPHPPALLCMPAHMDGNTNLPHRLAGTTARLVQGRLLGQVAVALARTPPQLAVRVQGRGRGARWSRRGVVLVVEVLW